MGRGALVSLAVLVVLVSCGDSKKAAEVRPATVATTPPFDPVVDAAGSYRIAIALAPAEMKRGAVGRLTLGIEMTRPDVHVQKEFPLKATLSPSAGLELARSSLGYADALEPAGTGRRWVVDVTAARSGRQKVDAALRFAICKESEPAWCVVRNESVSTAVEVR